MFRCFLLLALTACAQPVKESGTVPLRILSFNDFHGQIQSENPSPGKLPVMNGGVEEMVDAGGAAYLAGLIARERAEHPNHILVSGGDLTGASPLTSALLQDEPTIRVMNRIGLDLNVVGNHEFDYGRAELLRKAEGGCLEPDDCRQGPFQGAAFDYLAANVVDEVTGAPFFSPYAIREFDGIPVGFIGVVTDETPFIVSAAGIKGLKFLDAAETLNLYAAELRSRGVGAIVAVMHEGASVPADIATDGSPCIGMVGALTDMVEKTDDDVDLFITGHTHQSYACRLDGRLVIQTASYGRMLSVTDLMLDRASGDVVSAAVKNLPVTRDIDPDAEIVAEVAGAEAATAPIRAQPVAEFSGQVLRLPDANGESALGDVIADAQLASAKLLGAEIAFMNPGGIRQDLPSDPAAGPAVTLGDLFAVQPFGNNLVAMDLTGAEIKLLLEQQWIDQPEDRRPRMLQISDGFSYCFDDRRADGDKILASTMKLGGSMIDPAKTYRIVVNSFLADGGDRFTVLKNGGNRSQGEGDLDALRAHLTSGGDVPLKPQSRICRAS
ncbi:bifunctional UDP-sugar hydrolase/5'-nucleotidase [Dongia sp.]|uniref:bifunctional metallophosphatase/5'-nucleotidase n=1 Tax=Dongia sp. TaxID=1977262 RepID=UPI0035B0A020